jgi:hypothetical protein
MGEWLQQVNDVPGYGFVLEVERMLGGCRNSWLYLAAA